MTHLQSQYAAVEELATKQGDGILKGHVLIQVYRDNLVSTPGVPFTNMAPLPTWISNHMPSKVHARIKIKPC